MPPTSVQYLPNAKASEDATKKLLREMGAQKDWSKFNNPVRALGMTVGGTTADSNWYIQHPVTSYSASSLV